MSTVFKSQYYLLQLDESTNVCNSANLLAFMTYEFEYKIQEALLFCNSLPSCFAATTM